MSQTTTAAAISAAIDAQFATPRVVSMTEAASRTTDHIIVFISRRYTEGRLASGEARVIGGRVITRYITKDDGNVRVMRERTAAAVEEKFLPGSDGPLAFETSTEVEEDDGWFVASDSWTY